MIEGRRKTSDLADVATRVDWYGARLVVCAVDDGEQSIVSGETREEDRSWNEQVETGYKSDVSILIS